MFPYSDDEIARFWSHVAIRGPTACWLWQLDPGSDGYGRLHLRRGRGNSFFRPAHRMVLEIVGGCTLPTGVVVRHSCDTPLCCNPAHLAVGSHLDNMRDMVDRGRRAVLPQDGANNGNAKLTRADVVDIKRLFHTGLTNIDLGKKFGVHHATISAIRRGRSWSEVGW